MCIRDRVSAGVVVVCAGVVVVSAGVVVVSAGVVLVGIGVVVVSTGVVVVSAVVVVVSPTFVISTFCSTMFLAVRSSSFRRLYVLQLFFSPCHLQAAIADRRGI